jgi:hypothetical protein
MKQKILDCKTSNPTWGYKNIAKFLGCAYSTVAYYLNPEGKKRSFARTRKHRANFNGILKRKKDNFQCIAGRRCTKAGLAGGRNRAASLFSAQELKDKLLSQPICYLTGLPINLLEPKTYELDHIQPIAKGGDNSLSNCGLTLKAVNRAKSDSTLEEFEEICKLVLIHRGYSVSKMAEAVGTAPTSPVTVN